MAQKRKRDGLVCAKPNRRVFAYISSQRGPIDLSFFVLKPCAIAVFFAYKDPYEFFPYKGFCPTLAHPQQFFSSSPKTPILFEF